jgi:hypothetical protein
VEQNYTKTAFIVVREGQTIGEMFRRIHEFEANANVEAERLVKKEGVSFRVYKIELIGICKPRETPVEWVTKNL